MLSQYSREEIIRKLTAKVGYPVEEAKLSPETRRAIANLADFQRHLFLISEILNGERGRVEQSLILSAASKLHRDKEMDAHVEEIVKLQKEVDAKISEISAQIVLEDEAKQSGVPAPSRGGGLEALELKCPTCGAGLPLPAGRYVKCKYCDSTISIQDVSSQIRDMIKSV